MLIVEDEIASLGLVSPSNHVELKNSTCDLTIGKIIPTGDVDHKLAGESLQEFWLEPSHMVFVVSLQRVSLPRNVTGLATLVTTLTKEGILCLNTGIVDPGYDGHLGATLVNFSSKPRKIALNDRLFRVVFLKHEAISDDNFKPYSVKKRDYVLNSVSKSKNEFLETFLDVKGIQELARARAWSIVWSSILTNWLPWIALLVSLAALGFQIFGAEKGS